MQCTHFAQTRDKLVIKVLHFQVPLLFLLLSVTTLDPVLNSAYFKPHIYLSPNQFRTAMKRGVMGKLLANLKPNAQWSYLSTISRYPPTVWVKKLEKEPISKPKYGLSFEFEAVMRKAANPANLVCRNF